MNPDSNLFFIKDRISEIGSALLYNMSSDFVKLPCSIITILEADEKGHLWFFTNRPRQYMSSGEKSFPARLKFYRKGKPFFVEVSGHAIVSEDKNRIRRLAGVENEITGNSFQNLMLVDLKIKKAEYHEPKPVKTSDCFVLQLKTFLVALFKPAYSYRSFEINPEII